jgi:hypothetical protein
MKQALFTNWTFLRVLRLLIGLAIVAQAIITKDSVFGIAGLVFTSMALFNVGCCGTAGCNAPIVKNEKSLNDISYEEVV